MFAVQINPCHFVRDFLKKGIFSSVSTHSAPCASADTHVPELFRSRFGNSVVLRVQQYPQPERMIVERPAWARGLVAMATLLLCHGCSSLWVERSSPASKYVGSWQLERIRNNALLPQTRARSLLLNPLGSSGSVEERG